MINDSITKQAQARPVTCNRVHISTAGTVVFLSPSRGIPEYYFTKAWPLHSQAFLIHRFQPEPSLQDMVYDATERINW